MYTNSISDIGKYTLVIRTCFKDNLNIYYQAIAVKLNTAPYLNLNHIDNYTFIAGSKSGKI